MSVCLCVGVCVCGCVLSSIHGWGGASTPAVYDPSYRIANISSLCLCPSPCLLYFHAATCANDTRAWHKELPSTPRYSQVLSLWKKVKLEFVLLALCRLRQEQYDIVDNRTNELFLWKELFLWHGALLTPRFSTKSKAEGRTCGSRKWNLWLVFGHSLRQVATRRPT